MEMHLSEHVCGTCNQWGGKRDAAGSENVEVSPSSRGMCAIRKKPKPAQGGCDDWQKWESQSKT
jgi:hypothetical protein